MRIFHLVRRSPWPLTGSIGALGLATGLVIWFHYKSIKLIIIAKLLITITIVIWWRDVIRERNRYHTTKVVSGIRWGIILFITSEVIFFFSFFWAFFRRRAAPTVEIGSCWPPKGIQPLNPFSVPFLNTLVLLSSGLTVTWAHHALVNQDYKNRLLGLTTTVILGFYFTLLQGYEYYEAPFSISDSVYGSTFFVITGFHGLHVIIGRIFLTICLIRLNQFHFSSSRHFGLEAAAWYWHFVDVVWLFLFICVYWWGS